MKKEIKQALSFYDINIKKVKKLNDDNDAFMLTDTADKRYFLKTYYSDRNACDIIPGENIYHTYKQIYLESEILLRLSDSGLKTAAPFRNKNGGFVTTLAPNADGGAVYAAITSFVDGLVMKHTEAPTVNIAYCAGVSAAKFHLESKKSLLTLAVKRPHKRQDYMLKMKGRLAQGIKTGAFTAVQYEMLKECCDVIIDCMNRLDKDPERNLGLVHTDIINGNIIYSQNHCTLIDFSRSVYSYYLYDLAEMVLHGNFGGSGPDLQRAILNGYHSEKPLNKEDLFSMQIMFAMFILTVMAACIDSGQNAWLEGVLKWFAGEVHPGLVSGNGYMKPPVFEGLITDV